MATRPGWRASAQHALAQVTGFRLVRVHGLPRGRARPPQRPDDRLLPDPVFLLSSVRSGSTLLRALLNAHTEIHSPHETHFRRLQVVPSTPPAHQALTADGLSIVEAEHLLWDRLLHRSLQASGKRVLVEKTPSNVFALERLRTAWPHARFIFLIRHPLSIAQSWSAADPRTRPMRRAVPHTLHYLEHLERARQSVPGVTVRYEDLTADPERELRRLCAFLGVDWQADMLDYGRTQRGPFRAGIGDWSSNIHSGRVQAARPLPTADEVPEALTGIARAWGYLDASPAPEPSGRRNASASA